jgi:uroporphyrinogen-III synthase
VNSLSHRGIVITRPWQQAQVLATMVRDAGAEPILFPLLEIVELNDYSAFDETIDQLDSFDWAIFISSNAVEHGMPRLLARRGLPPQLQFAAIGPVTAAELAKFGVIHTLTPQGRFDSESLLALPEFAEMHGKRCLIFRGQGGRELLANALKRRGASVSFAECYRRVNPSHDISELTRLWQNGTLDALVVTSSEALRNLLDLFAHALLSKTLERDWLKEVPIFVNHPRIAETASKHGLQAITTQEPGDNGMLATLVNWFEHE